DDGARITPDILVGADGIHSAVRGILFGEEAPQFAGCVAYRGLVPVERIADLGLELGSQSWVGPGAHLVHYFVSRRQLLNFMGQGAAQAIEDGASLAACLAAEADEPSDALQRYERLRLPRVTRLQELSRANKLRFHMHDGPGQAARDAEWARAADRSPDALRWLYEHDPAALEPVPM